MHFYHCPAWMPCLYPSILRPSLITAPFQGSYCLNSQTLPFVCVWNIVFYDLAQVEVSSCLDQEESANCLLRGLMASYLSKVVTSKWKVLCESPWKTKQPHAVVKHLNLCNFPSWLSIDLRNFFFFLPFTDEVLRNWFLWCEEAPNRMHHTGFLQTWVKLGVVV